MILPAYILVTLVTARIVMWHTSEAASQRGWMPAVLLTALLWPILVVLIVGRLVMHLARRVMP